LQSAGSAHRGQPWRHGGALRAFWSHATRERDGHGSIRSCAFRAPAAKIGDAETVATGEGSRDLMLVALPIASGAIDAISYFGLGKIFSAFMTGNIVFSGFGIANMKEPCLPAVLALSTFAAGSFLGLRMATLRSQESGWWPQGCRSC
jgi:hypothetical protein